MACQVEHMSSSAQTVQEFVLHPSKRPPKAKPGRLSDQKPLVQESTLVYSIEIPYIRHTPRKPSFTVKQYLPIRKNSAILPQQNSVTNSIAALSPRFELLIRAEKTINARHWLSLKAKNLRKSSYFLGGESEKCARFCHKQGKGGVLRKGLFGTNRIIKKLPERRRSRNF